MSKTEKIQAQGMIPVDNGNLAQVAVSILRYAADVIEKYGAASINISETSVVSNETGTSVESTEAVEATADAGKESKGKKAKETAEKSKTSTEDTKSEKPEKPAEETTTASTSITVDDLIRTAAAKVKANKANTDKIGSLVKSYGVETLRELPEGKYEDFFTDLTQI